MKPRKPVRKVSKRRQMDNAEYVKLKRQWKRKLIADGKWCCQGCGTIPEDSPHHKHGRGPNLLNVKTWVQLCWLCHKQVHEHPAQARKDGLLCDKGQWMKRQLK